MYKMGFLVLFWGLSESLRSSPDGLKSVSKYLHDPSTKISLHAPLHWIQSTHSIKSLELLLTEKPEKYHKTYFPKYYIKNECSNEGGSQKVEHRYNINVNHQLKL